MSSFRKTFDSAFKFIADQLNLSPADENDVAWKSFATALGSSGEYRDIADTRLTPGSVVAGHDQKSSLHGLRTPALMSPKITFANESIEAFEREIGLASECFANFEQYSGIAVHCYETYRRMKSESSHSGEFTVDRKSR